MEVKERREGKMIEGENKDKKKESGEGGKEKRRRKKEIYEKRKV